jgi:hypothetical protein
MTLGPFAFRNYVIGGYNYNNEVEEDERSEACSTNGQKRNAYRSLVGKPERKKPIGRPRHWWVNNIRMDLVEVRCGDVDWIGLAQDRDMWRALVY